MSHFVGLVVLTPEYAKSNGMDDSLAQYDENKEVEESRKRDVSDFEIIEFLEYYALGNEAEPHIREGYNNFKKGFIGFMRRKKGFVTKKQFKADHPQCTGTDDYVADRYLNFLISKNKDRFVDYFKVGYPNEFASFPALYKEKGEDWNGSQWRVDENGVWGYYSTYNPDSKWDWYSVGGRWGKGIKTKDGEFVDMCKLGEIDFEPYPEDAYVDGTDFWGNPCKELKDGFEWHYDNKDNLPFCLVIDGVWRERAEMGWWACTSNEKDPQDWHKEVTDLLANLPADSFVYSVDFHI
jgi:hypothetical protein